MTTRRLLTEIEHEADREEQTEVNIKVPKGKKVTVNIDEEEEALENKQRGKRLLVEG